MSFTSAPEGHEQRTQTGVIFDSRGTISSLRYLRYDVLRLDTLGPYTERSLNRTSFLPQSLRVPFQTGSTETLGQVGEETVTVVDPTQEQERTVERPERGPERR